jgi:lauroyl/myristoyl acyltransferase
VALGCSMESGEEAAARVSAIAMQSWLSLDEREATANARRRMLLRRDAALHEMLALQLPPAQLEALLDESVVEGVEHVRAASSRQGVLFLSLHYSLYSSLLILWLARAASRGLFDHLAVLYWATEDGGPATFVEAMRRSQAAGFVSESALRLIDLGEGPVRATRLILDGLQEGGAALVFSDRLSPPGAERRAVTVTLGGRPLGVARGVPWLVHAARGPVIPVHIRPDSENRHRIVFAPALAEGPGTDASAVVQSALQRLVDSTVMIDPAPWDAWPSLAKLEGRTGAGGPAQTTAAT